MKVLKMRMKPGAKGDGRHLYTISRIIAVTLAIAFLALNTAQAQQPTTVTDTRAKQALAVTVLGNKYKTGSSAEDLVGFATFIALNKAIDADLRNNRVRTAEEYNKLSLSFQARYTEDLKKFKPKISPNMEAVLNFSASVAATSAKAVFEKAGYAADVGKDFTQTVVGILARDVSLNKSYLAENRRWDLHQQAWAAVDNILYRSFGVYDQVPAIRDAFNKLIFAETKGVDYTRSFNELATLFPTFVPATLRTGSDKNVRFDPQAEVKRSIGPGSPVAELISKALPEDRAILKRESDQQLANGFPQTGKLPNPEPDENRQKRRQQQRELAFNTFNFSTQLISLVNPQLATQVHTVGTTTVQTVTAVSDYLKQVKQFKAAGDGLAIANSSVLLTGNLVGAGFQIFSLFGSGGPSMDEVMLQEIQALRQQIEFLRFEIRDRFDRVDLQLRTILDTLVSRFDQIDYKLGIVIGDITEIRAGLLTMEAKLNRLEQYLAAWLTAPSKDEFIRRVNGCLGYKRKFGVDMPFSDFRDCATFFYTWATTTAANELWAGPTVRDYNDIALYDNLNNFPINVNINFIAQFISKNLGLTPLSFSRLANPTEYALASQVYLQLFWEWPQHAQRLNAEWLDDIQRMGQSINFATQTITLSSGTGVLKKAPILDQVIAKYRAVVKNVNAVIESVETQFTATPGKLSDPTGRVTFKLWGGASGTTTTWYPTQSASTGAIALPLPNNFFDQLDQLYRVSEVLSLGNNAVHFEQALWVAVNDEPGSDPRCGQKKHFWFRVYLQYRFNSTVVRRYSALVDPGTHYWGYACEDGSVVDNSIVMFHRDRVQKALQTSKAEVSLSGPQIESKTALMKALNSALDDQLRKRQRELYAQIAKEVSVAGSGLLTARQLDATIYLFRDLFNLGLPFSVEANDYVRSFVLAGGLVDSSTVAQFYEAASKSDIPDTTVKLQFAATAEARITALSDVVAAVLKGIEKNQEPESLAFISDILDQIQAYKIAGTAATPTPTPTPTPEPTPNPTPPPIAPPNQPPTASAGPDQTVTAGQLTRLTGSGSDPEGQRVAYSWNQVQGPAVSISGATGTVISFVAPSVVAPTVLRFRLTVSDGTLTGQAFANITVNPVSLMQFPQFPNGAGVTSEIVLINPSGSGVAAMLELYGDVGQPIITGFVRLGKQSKITVVVPAYGAATISTDGAGPLISGSARVISTGPLGGIVRFAIPGIGVTGVGESQALSDAIVPVRRRTGGINTGIAIADAGAGTQLLLTLRNSTGTQLSTISLVLPPNGSTAKFIDELFPGVDTTSFDGTLAVVATTTGKVMVVGLELGNIPGQFMTLPVTPLQ